jgi:hypothetical protein
MKGTWSDNEGNSFAFDNDEIILKGPYWDTIGVSPGRYRYQAVKPKITVNVNKRNGNPLELIEVHGGNGQLLVNDEICKAFHIDG